MKEFNYHVINEDCLVTLHRDNRSILCPRQNCESVAILHDAEAVQDVGIIFTNNGEVRYWSPDEVEEIILFRGQARILESADKHSLFLLTSMGELLVRFDPELGVLELV